MDVNSLLNDAETSHRYALDGRQAQMWTALPAVVTNVNLVKMTVDVQPAIMGVQANEDGSETPIPLPLLLDCPICFPSAGGFLLTMPITLGDEVLVVIASRCIDSWWQLGGVQIPMEFRMHDLSDGFAIPGPRSLPRVALLTTPVSAVNAQLRNAAGTTYVEITPMGRINLVAPAGVGVVGNLTVTGNLAASGNVAVAGNVAAVGTVHGSNIP